MNIEVRADRSLLRTTGTTTTSRDKAVFGEDQVVQGAVLVSRVAAYDLILHPGQPSSREEFLVGKGICLNVVADFLWNQEVAHRARRGSAVCHIQKYFWHRVKPGAGTYNRRRRRDRTDNKGRRILGSGDLHYVPNNDQAIN